MENRKLSRTRPRKMESEKLKYRVVTRFKTGDYFELKAKARTANMRLSSYLKLCATQSVITPRLSPEEMGYIRNICNMGNNLNQIAKRANEAGYSYVAQVHRNIQRGLNDAVNMMQNGGKNYKE